MKMQVCTTTPHYRLYKSAVPHPGIYVLSSVGYISSHAICMRAMSIHITTTRSERKGFAEYGNNASRGALLFDERFIPYTANAHADAGHVRTCASFGMDANNAYDGEDDPDEYIEKKMAERADSNRGNGVHVDDVDDPDEYLEKKMAERAGSDLGNGVHVDDVDDPDEYVERKMAERADPNRGKGVHVYDVDDPDEYLENKIAERADPVGVESGAAIEADGATAGGKDDKQEEEVHIVRSEEDVDVLNEIIDSTQRQLSADSKDPVDVSHVTFVNKPKALSKKFKATRDALCNAILDEVNHVSGDDISPEEQPYFKLYKRLKRFGPTNRKLTYEEVQKKLIATMERKLFRKMKRVSLKLRRPTSSFLRHV